MALGRNLVVVLGHGLRSDALGDGRAWPLQTPNFLRMIKRGIRLSAVSSCPADHGGLVSLLTGLHARQHGYVDQEALAGATAVCTGWPVLLADAGYHVAGVGCVGPIEPWLKDAVLVDSVDRVKTTRCAYMSAMRTKGMEPALQQQRDRRHRLGPFEPDRLLIDCEDDVDGFIAAKARTMIQQMPTDQPWALVVIFSGPANDLPPPTLFEYIVDPQHLEHGFVPADLKHVDLLAELDYPRVLLQRLEPHGLGRIRADYLGRVSLLDYSVGRLMAAVSDRIDAHRTWSVVTSDRGHLLGEHGLVGHRSFLSGAVDVPVLVVPPKPVTQRVSPGLLSTVDIAATIATIGGCDLPKAATGRSLVPMVNGERLAPRCWPGCLSEFGKRLMLCTERYKVIFDTEVNEVVALYDRIKDPDERSNLAPSAIGMQMLDSLRCRLADMLLGMRAMPGTGV